MAGMTLIEVILSLSFIVMALLGILYTAMVSVRLNRVTEQEVAGTNIINGQLESLFSIAVSNSVEAHGVAKGLIYYLQGLSDKLPSDPSYPVKVALDNSRGCIVYEFPIPPPGESLSGLLRVDGQRQDQRGTPLGLTDTYCDYGKGVMLVYIEEDSVPSRFYQWDDLQKSGSGEIATPRPGSHSFFDMDGDAEGGSDFKTLMTSGTRTDYAKSDLASLPIRMEVRYYNSRADMLGDSHPSLPGFKDEIGAAPIQVSRDYILNNTALVGL